MVIKDFDKNNEPGSPQGEPTQKKARSKKNKVSTSASTKKADAKAVDELAQEISAEAEALDELTQALAETQELRDRHLRLKAEWDNYRKRTEAERADERNRATQRLVEKILPVLDDLERAIEHSESASEEPLKDGVAQVYGKLQDVLTSEGVKIIDPQNEPFDANKHNAVSKIEDKHVPDETVLEVYQKGYEMGSRILRPAMVVVSSR